MKKRWSRFIDERISNTHILQVPHHGSRSNWQKSLLDNLANSALIINYGTRNTYGHPNAEVKKEIRLKSPQRQAFDNTELRGFKYRVFSIYSCK